MRGRRGFALADREPIQMFRTLAIEFPELDAAMLANTPLSCLNESLTIDVIFNSHTQIRGDIRQAPWHTGRDNDSNETDTVSLEYTPAVGKTYLLLSSS